MTGASSGLGVTLARGLAEAGADVVLAARRTDKLAETQATIEGLGRRAIAVTTDVADPDDCTRCVQEAVDAFGGVHVLVNNAGTGKPIPALKEEPDAFRQVLDVNLAGCHWMACAAARVMERGASIINISSILEAITAGIPQAAYTASKAGLGGLTRDLAHQWGGRRGIRVNALAPGFFVTEMTSDHMAGTEHLIARMPLGRMGEPDELLGALVYLASDASSYVTGQTITIDGGFSTS